MATLKDVFPQYPVAFSKNPQRERGLGLPDGVLRKPFRESALRWLPGLDG